MFFKNKGEILKQKQLEKEMKIQDEERKRQEEERVKQEELNKILLKQKIDAKYEETINKMIIEEIRLPGSHKTYFKVDRIGEGLFFGFSKSIEDANKFLNKIIFNQNQIINISARGDDSLLKDYIVTYWEIDDRNLETYNKVKEDISNEPCSI